MLKRETVDKAKFNQHADLPYQLRLADFEIAMQDVYDFFYDVNKLASFGIARRAMARYSASFSRPMLS